jgi:hypothetical protein
MQLDREYLRQHYASLSDEALLATNRSELVETAQKIFDLEMERRNLTPLRDTGRAPEQPAASWRPDPAEEEELPDETGFDTQSPEGDEKPEWLEDAVEAYSWAVRNGTEPTPEGAVDAHDVLEAAGIPCCLNLCEVPPEKSLTPYGTHRWRLMVPGNLSLQAANVMERDISNTEVEAFWKTYLETLSDKELRATTPKVVFCGLYDRMARVNRVYDEEMARRKLK